jgi:hypothetical protein
MFKKRVITISMRLGLPLFLMREVLVRVNNFLINGIRKKAIWKPSVNLKQTVAHKKILENKQKQSSALTAGPTPKVPKTAKEALPGPDKENGLLP